MANQLQTTHRNLGELAAMAEKTEATERRILARAKQLLADAQRAAAAARAGALAGDAKAGQDYQAAIEDQGRLQRVIASANAALA